MIDRGPAVGDIVRYQAYGTPGGEFKSVARAAIVTEVHGAFDPGPGDAAYVGEVTLCVLNPSGIFFNRVRYSATPEPGRWSWPPAP